MDQIIAHTQIAINSDSLCLRFFVARRSDNASKYWLSSSICRPLGFATTSSRVGILDTKILNHRGLENLYNVKVYRGNRNRARLFIYPRAARWLWLKTVLKQALTSQAGRGITPKAQNLPINSTDEASEKIELSEITEKNCELVCTQNQFVGRSNIILHPERWGMYPIERR
jgi:hypothetical protein